MSVAACKSDPGLTSALGGVLISHRLAAVRDISSRATSTVSDVEALGVPMLKGDK